MLACMTIVGCQGGAADGPPLVSSGRPGLDIVPTFTDSAGKEWTGRRRAVVLRAIADYENGIAEDETIAVEFKFYPAEPGTYAMWYVIDFPPEGTSVRPWTAGLTHVIMIDANGTGDWIWFDETPATDGDVPGRAIDALTLVRHELGHMLGHRPAYCTDFDADGQVIDYWQNLIDADGVFDPGGLNVELAYDREHVVGSHLMSYYMTPGRRHGIAAVLRRLVVAYGYSTR